MGFVEAINTLVLKLKRKKERYYGENIKINLGAGSNTTRGWINIDASPNALVSGLPTGILSLLYHFSSSRTFLTKKQYLDSIKKNKLIHFDLEKGIPVKSDTAIEIYNNDFLEHLFRESGEMMISECYRVLKKGGTLRMQTQDLDKLINEYQKGNREEFNRLVFNKKGQQYFSMHKFFYGFEDLKKFLVKTGFKNVKYIQPKKEFRKVNMIVTCQK